LLKLFDNPNETSDKAHIKNDRQPQGYIHEEIEHTPGLIVRGFLFDNVIYSLQSSSHKINIIWDAQQKDWDAE